MDCTDLPGLMTLTLAVIKSDLQLMFRHDAAEPDSEIEGVPHIALWNRSMLLKPVEQSWPGPALRIDRGTDGWWQAAGQVFRQTTSSDVSHALDADALR